ncbi:MAG TPA: J domain-containing protein [Planctomycetaceae bacterium]|nr:J domain-containing protein [Planctomycetaceae bacterium]HIQ21706.1 J domain-containing protein [Planctomycetota bacterium]
MEDDYYKTLGVSRNASQAEIQKAYRKLARKYHPDRNPGDETAKKKFQKIQAAFDVLNDPKKREMYDRYGSSFEHFGPGGGAWSARPGEGFAPGGFEDIDFAQFFGERFGGEAGFDFSDLFSQFRTSGFGKGTAKRQRSRRGADLEYELTIPFATAVGGGRAQLTVRRPSGKTETLEIKIPPGIEEGKKIRLRNQGQPGPGGGPPGDLLVKIHVAPHPCYERRGRKDLVVRVPVTVAEAALGATVDLPTPRGTVAVRVPPGTSSGAKLRIRGHGVQALGGPPGDLLAEIMIVLPKKMDESTRRLCQQLADKYAGENPRARLQW